MRITKDIYLYIGDFCDNKTIISLLSVNTKIHKDDYFNYIMIKKYPLLYQQFIKSDEDNLKKFFMKMILYIEKLKRDYDFPYIPEISFNPEHFYNQIIKYSIDSNHFIWYIGLNYAIKTNKNKYIEYMTNRIHKKIKQ